MKLDASPALWQLGGLAVLALVMAVALVTDTRHRCIPNRLVFVALCAGLLVHVTGPVNNGGGGGLFGYGPGALGVKGALLGALTGMALFLPLYALRAMGAGDVKLMAGIGSFAGPADTLNIALFILAMGGVLAVARMLWAGTARRVMANVMLALSPVVQGGPRLFDPAKHSADRMPYALAMAAGLLTYGAWLWLGGSPLFRF